MTSDCVSVATTADPLSWLKPDCIASTDMPRLSDESLAILPHKVIGRIAYCGPGRGLRVAG
jgi:hypothetical protein